MRKEKGRLLVAAMLVVSSMCHAQSDNHGGSASLANAGTGKATRASGTPTLFFLNTRGQVLRMPADARERTVIVSDAKAGVGPDGIAVDTSAGHVYWTDMGKVSADDGSVMRADLDGSNVRTIVPIGGTFTPKQLKLDAKNRKLYWSDREGMRIMRANLDGSQLETLVITGSSETDRKDPAHWCVGIALDVEGGKLYWTQKGGDNARSGTIKRANLDLPKGIDPARRTDVEVLFAGLPEPIDLELDLGKRHLYWTDRGDDTISRAPMDRPRGVAADARKDREILVRGVSEAIGIALDLPRGRLYYTSLRGVVGTAALDGSGATSLLTDQGPMTGIAVAEL
jgi:sugar lactone lactonase YvrE